MPKKDANGRAYPSRPLVGVGGVVVREKELLLVRRGAPPSQGLWSLPGGAVELGEGLAAALKREVLEECGISILVGPIAAVFDAIYRDRSGRFQYHYVLIDFLADYKEGELAAGTDAIEAAWASFDELSGFNLADGARRLLSHLLSTLPGLRSDRGVSDIYYGQI